MDSEPKLVDGHGRLSTKVCAKRRSVPRTHRGDQKFGASQKHGRVSLLAVVRNILVRKTGVVEPGKRMAAPPQVDGSRELDRAPSQLFFEFPDQTFVGVSPASRVPPKQVMLPAARFALAGRRSRISRPSTASKIRQL